MPQNLYEGFAVTFNFIFMALAILIATYGYRELRADRKSVKRAIAETPRAECVGSLVVVSGNSPFLSKGASVDLPREGTIGRSRACDVRLVHADMPARAARVSLDAGGIMFSPMRWENITVNGKAYDRPVIVSSGSRVQWGGLTLRLMLDDGAAESLGAVTAGNVEIAEPPVRRVRRVKAKPAAPAEDDVIESVEAPKPRPPRKKVMRTFSPIDDSLKYGNRAKTERQEVDIPLGVDKRSK